jgi:hypothetical protein
MSFVASGVRSVRVSNGASRLRRSSALFGFDLARFRPSCELVFIAKHSTSFAGNIARLRGLCIAENEKTLHPSFRVEQLLSQRVLALKKCIQAQIHRLSVNTFLNVVLHFGVTNARHLGIKGTALAAPE